MNWYAFAIGVMLGCALIQWGPHRSTINIYDCQGAPLATLPGR